MVHDEIYLNVKKPHLLLTHTKCLPRQCFENIPLNLKVISPIFDVAKSRKLPQRKLSVADGAFLATESF